MSTSLSRFILYTFLLFVSLSAAAQGGMRGRIEAEPELSGGNYYLYQVPSDSLTPPPAGYTPFYISHYGRHGSRWLIGEGDYSKPQVLLHSQDSLGNLTDLGKNVMERLDIVCGLAEGRYEELTAKGAEQHAGIAERMYRNFPSVFVEGASVVAKSTVVIRCILSMTAATNTLASLVPGLEISTDASKHDMVYMNWSDRAKLVPNISSGDVMKDFAQKRTHPERFMASIFKDASGVDQSFYNWMFSIAGNMQDAPSDISFYDLFTADELYDLYSINNASWYVNHADCPFTGGVKQYHQSNLLRMIIAEADDAIEQSRVGADLRFGHDGIVAGVVVLMGLEGCSYSTDNLETLSDFWNICDIIPMAANIQLVFYHNEDGDILMKVLFNEKETALPIQAMCGPYYRWNEVRDYWQDVLKKSPVPEEALNTAS